MIRKGSGSSSRKSWVEAPRVVHDLAQVIAVLRPKGAQDAFGTAAGSVDTSFVGRGPAGRMSLCLRSLRPSSSVTSCAVASREQGWELWLIGQWRRCPLPPCRCARLGASFASMLDAPRDAGAALPVHAGEDRPARRGERLHEAVPAGLAVLRSLALDPCGQVGEQ